MCVASYTLAIPSTPLCTYAHMHVHTHTHTHARMHTNTHTYTHTHACLHSNTHRYTHTRMHTHTHTQASFEPLGLTVAVAKDRAIESLMQVCD